MALPPSNVNYVSSANIDPDLFNQLIKSEEDLNELRKSNKLFNDIKSDLQSKFSNPVTCSNNEQFLSSDEQEKIRNFKLVLRTALNLQKEVLSLPFISDSNVTHLDLNQQQLLNLKFLKAIALTVHHSNDTISDSTKKSIQAFINHLSTSIFRLVITENDLKNLDGWIKEIVDCQELFRKFLPSAAYPQGHSQGILFTIKKRGELRGWFFGTIHNLTPTEMKQATDLCPNIYQRLFQSSIICTEIKLTNGSVNDSVENHLLQFARPNGIVNFGMDSIDRDRVGGDGKSTEEKKYIPESSVNSGFWRDFVLENEESMKNWLNSDNVSEENKSKIREILELREQHEMQLNAVIEPYCKGRLNLLKDVLEKMVLKQPESRNPMLENKRQLSLINNTHACLSALEKVHVEGGGIPKGFFAYGAAHLICDNLYQKTVVQGLKDLGWDVEVEDL